MLVEKRARACVETVNAPFSACFIGPLGFVLRCHRLQLSLFISCLVILDSVMLEQWMGLEDLQTFQLQLFCNTDGQRWLQRLPERVNEGI